MGGSALLPAVPPLEVRDGLLWTEAVEINAAWHCNIACESCSHGSPSMPTRFAEVSQVAGDLRSLARWMRTDHVRLVGGEPLIHPDVVGILQGIHSSGISTRSRIITNGLVLLDQPPGFWATITEVHVSIYPNMKRFHDRNREAIIRVARQTATPVTFKTFDYFRKSFRPVDGDDALTEAIYRTCQVANRWRCLTVENGYIYRCPQSALTTLQSGPTASADRLAIEEIGSLGELRDWITRPTPLEACQGCSGSVGRLHPHRQLRRHEVPSMDGDVDVDYLAVLLDDPDASNGCVTCEEAIG